MSHEVRHGPDVPAGTGPRPQRRWARLVGIVAAASLVGSMLAVGSTVTQAPPAAAQNGCGTDLATAAPTLSVDRTTLPSNAASTVNVSGSRFLTGPYRCGSGKYGGIYVFFGWVEPGGQWGPSHRGSTTRRGQFGTSYSYPGEGGGAEVRDDGSGTIRLVSFTTEGASGSETTFHMDGSGNWAAPITIRGPVYSWNDVVTGAANSVDCRVVQCGIYTVGAHGIASQTNEVFTPITFTGAGGPPSVVQPGAVSGPGGAVAQPGSVGAPSGGAAAAGGAVGGPSSPEPGDRSGASGPGDAPVAAAGVDIPGAPGVDAAPTTTVVDDVTRTERAGAVQVFDDTDGGGSVPLAPVLGVVALLAAAGLFVWRRRSSRPSTDPTPETA